MEGIFFVKHVGQMQSIKGKNGEDIPKLSVVISTKEARIGDSGCYGLDQDFVVDLLGDRAKNFNYKPGEWIVASLSFAVREYNGQYYPDVRLTSYCTLG